MISNNEEFSITSQAMFAFANPISLQVSIQFIYQHDKKSNTCLHASALTLILRTAFLPNKLLQTLQCNHFYILYASFDAHEVKSGGVVWVWGS